MLTSFRIAFAVMMMQIVASAGELNFYSSGSTGVDGPFAPEVVNGKLQGPVPAGSRMFVNIEQSVTTFFILVPLPRDGVFNFTSFSLPSDHVMAFDTRGTTNPGVVILASSDIRLDGVISVAPRHAWLASVSDYSVFKQDQKMISPIPGPGGFRGGLAQGFSPSRFAMGMFDELQPKGVTLPVTGGKGMNFEHPSIGSSGGAGTLVVATSTKVIFGTNKITHQNYYSTSHFDTDTPMGFLWQNDGRMYGMQQYHPTCTDGDVVVFANETKGRISQESGILVAAFEQEYYYNNSMSPPWPVGVRGADMPIDPSARFVEFAGKSLTAVGEADRVVLEKSGNYNLALETRNLPPGIIFRSTLRKLDPKSGEEIGKSTLIFPPTATVAAGVCRAEVMIPITPGGTYITAIATSPIETVYSPIIDGEPLTEMVAQLDLQGGQTIHFKTASGRQVDAAMAHREALKQGKTRFPAFKS